jgi:hypothetical protein
MSPAQRPPPRRVWFLVIWQLRACGRNRPSGMRCPGTRSPRHIDDFLTDLANPTSLRTRSTRTAATSSGSAAAARGHSRAAFYLVAASFEQAGMAGLLDERRGRRGPVKPRPEIAGFLRSAPPASGPCWPRRWRSGSGWCGTGVPSSGRAAGERPGVLAAGRGGAGRLPDAARLRAGRRLPARRAGRGPVRPPRPGRADRLARGRAGLPRRVVRRGPAAAGPARRPARPGAGGGLPVPARHAGRAGRAGPAADRGWS